MRDDVPLPPPPLPPRTYMYPLRTPLWRVPPLCGYAALRTLLTLPRPRSDASRLVSFRSAFVSRHTAEFRMQIASGAIRMPSERGVSLLETHSFPIARFFVFPSDRPSMSESVFAPRRALSRKKIPNVSRFDIRSVMQLIFQCNCPTIFRIDIICSR